LYFYAVNAKARIALSITRQVICRQDGIMSSWHLSARRAAMRLLGCLIIAACISFLHGPHARAQAADEHSPGASTEPVHQHRDHHHGHDQVYPDRGAIYHELPKGAVAVYHAGLPYKFFNGIWFEQHGEAFIVVAPAIGAVVTALPPSVTPVENGGASYLYANDTFYRARPDLGGYEVVNDPDEVIPPQPAKSPNSTAPAAAPAAAPAGAAAPAAMAAAPGSGAAVPAAMTAATVTAVAASAPTAAPAVATALPAAAATPAAAAPRGAKVVATPKNGQTPDVQARDHYECYKAAVAHSGFDPMHMSGSAAAQGPEQQSDYERTQAACFEGRGYSIQ
jgi:hypothetical protein